MSLRERIIHKTRQKALNREMWRTGGTPDTPAFHSRAYHKHFEGYTEYKVKNEKGRSITKRIYTGKYYEPDLAPHLRRRLRIAYVLLFVCAVGLFMYCGTRVSPCNTAPYVNAFQVIAVVLLFWHVYILVNYLANNGPLTIGEYNSIHKPLIRASNLSGICMWICCAMSILSFFLHFQDLPFLDLLCASGFFMSGLFLGIIYYLEYNLNYMVINNNTKVPEDGIEIE